MTATLPLLDGVKGDAALSPCGTYRYALTRDWWPKDRGHVLWIMLNPSVANADKDDRTLRRCQQFARDWGYDGITVANLFALRSTDPKALLTHPDPVGPANRDVIRGLLAAEGVRLVVAGWGEVAKALTLRRPAVEAWAFEAGRDLYCVTRTKRGAPGHPLYVKGETMPSIWRAAEPDDGGTDQ